MLAKLSTNFKLSYFFLVSSFVVLAACSRDNPLSIPEPFVEEEPLFCIEGSPYEPIILESVDITNLTGILPDDYPISYINKDVTVSTSYLIEAVNVSAATITDQAPSQTEDLTEGETAPSILVALNKSLTTEVERNISPEQSAFLLAFDPEINSISVNIDYFEDKSTLTKSFNDFDQVSVPVNPGLNYVTLRVVASLRVPRTAIDCDTPLTDEESDAEGFSNSDGYRNVNLIQNFPIIINKGGINEFTQDKLDSTIDLSSFDQSGKVLSISDEFLIVGLPNENTLAQGVYSASDFEFSMDVPPNAPLITFNDQSPKSGSVLIYQRNNNGWNFHSFIKSSNNESFDFFGSSVAINNNVLAISAPGEDSNASGLYLASSEELSNFKINNLALSSGAVYLYEYEPVSNTWVETHYIKPQNNVISDNDYNKGFGRALAINKSLLLISAQNDNSKTTEAENSEEPNSGAVHTYAFKEGWSYLSTLKALNPKAGDQFGSSIDLSDKLVAVGAPFQDSGFNKTINTDDYENTTSQEINNNEKPDSGAVYVFSYSEPSNQISLFSMIKPKNSDEFDYFGTSVSITNDNLFVGAIGEDSSGKGLNRGMNKNDLTDSGAVYAYVLNNDSNTWSEYAYIKADEPQASASFGRSIVFDREKLFISSPLFDSDNLINAGKLYLYHSKEGQINQELLFQVQGNDVGQLYGNLITIADGYLAFTTNDSITHN